jgi:hypothetical protein
LDKKYNYDRDKGEMNKIKIILGVVVFGSIWGLLECVLGSHLPGSVLTGGVALGLMTATRFIYNQKGMQAGMALVAAALMAFNPLGGCVICSVIAVAAEGAVFELVWFTFSSDIEKTESISIKICAGIVTAYACYTLAYVMSQIVTPLFFSDAKLRLGDLAVLIPNILSKGLVAGLIGGVVFPVVALVRKISVSFLRSRRYYPLCSIVAATCWIVVIILYG